MTKKDTFWKYFLLICATLIVGGGVLAYRIITYISPKSLPAIVLPSTAGDPFAHAQTPLAATTTDYFFRESVPFGYDKWSWGARVDWRSNSHYFEGVHALGITFTEAWSGVEIAGPGNITKGYRGLALAVYAETGIENLYIEIYDAKGTLIGRQSIGWYFPGEKIQPRQWHEITIPLENFGGYMPLMVGRVSIISREVGTVYIDSIRLTNTAVSHPRWQPLNEEAGVLEGPTLSELLLTTAPFPLPYRLEFTPLAAGMWYAMTGSFRFAATEGLLGLMPQSTDTTTLFLGGRTWTNYRASALIHWGTPSTFSLLARFTDESNYVSCAFSTYGMSVQIYQVEAGKSKLIAETPELSIPQIDPWKDVEHAVEVSGNRITCYVRGEKALSAEIPRMQPQGTVGMEAWNRDPGGIPHRIQTLTVSPL